jgi:hypothetical protein
MLPAGDSDNGFLATPPWLVKFFGGRTEPHRKCPIQPRELVANLLAVQPTVPDPGRYRHRAVDLYQAGGRIGGQDPPRCTRCADRHGQDSAFARAAHLPRMAASPPSEVDSFPRTCAKCRLDQRCARYSPQNTSDPRRNRRLVGHLRQRPRAAVLARGRRAGRLQARGQPLGEDGQRYLRCSLRTRQVDGRADRSASHFLLLSDVVGPGAVTETGRVCFRRLEPRWSRQFRTRLTDR